MDGPYIGIDPKIMDFPETDSPFVDADGFYIGARLCSGDIAICVLCNCCHNHSDSDCSDPDTCLWHLRFSREPCFLLAHLLWTKPCRGEYAQRHSASGERVQNSFDAFVYRTLSGPVMVVVTLYQQSNFYGFTSRLEFDGTLDNFLLGDAARIGFFPIDFADIVARSNAVRDSVICLIATMQSTSRLPKDIVKMIAFEVWRSRNDETVWEYQIEQCKEKFLARW